MPVELRLPNGYTDFTSQVEELRSVSAVTGSPALASTTTVRCHHDLLADNLVDDGTRPWIIDFEYSGTSDTLPTLIRTALGEDDP